MRADDPLHLQRYIGEDRDFDYVSVPTLTLWMAGARPPRGPIRNDKM